MVKQTVTKQRIQNQLRQFLKEYRNHHGLSAEQAAEKLNVEIATYRTLEGRKPANRVISVLEYLEKIASLNKMSLSAFVTFLERSQRTESGSSSLKRTLYKWEHDLLERFDKVGIPLRNRFMKGFTSRTDEETRDFMRFMAKVLFMTDSRRRALYSFLDEMEPDA